MTGPIWTSAGMALRESNLQTILTQRMMASAIAKTANSAAPHGQLHLDCFKRQFLASLDADLQKIVATSGF